jgi:diguanylate cyclase (GGDEF)-like protein
MGKTGYPAPLTIKYPGPKDDDQALGVKALQNGGRNSSHGNENFPFLVMGLRLVYNCCMRTFFANIVNTGTNEAYSPKKNQTARLINRVALIFICAVLPNTLFMAYYQYWLAVIEQGAAMFLMIMVIVVNGLGWFNLARFGTLIIGNLHVFLMVYIMGLDGGAYYYFAPVVIAPMFFFPPKEIRSIALWAILTVILTSVCLFVHPQLSFIGPIDPEMQKIFYYGSILGAQGVVFIFVMYFYRESYRYEKTLVKSNDELTILSEMDALTGLLNRRSFSDRIASEWRKSAHTGQPMSLLMLDADKFKPFNDYYGHPAGDDVLKKISEVLKENIRLERDFPGRYGGEEFIILLPETNRQTAMGVAERIRYKIERLEIRHEFNPGHLKVTCSIGVCTVVASEGISSELLIEQADKALYIAKGKGRNLVSYKKF